MKNIVQRIKECEADETREEETAIFEGRKVHYCPLILSYFNPEAKCLYLQRESYPIEERDNDWRIKIRHGCTKRYIVDFNKGDTTVFMEKGE